MSDDALVGAIWRLLTESPFHGKGHRKLWARLRFVGIHTSHRRFLRLTREHGLLAHQRAGRPHGSREHDGTITTDRVDIIAPVPVIVPPPASSGRSIRNSDPLLLGD